jgi:hypothetical protein
VNTKQLSPAGAAQVARSHPSIKRRELTPIIAAARSSCPFLEPAIMDTATFTILIRIFAHVPPLQHSKVV